MLYPFARRYFNKRRHFLVMILRAILLKWLKNSEDYKNNAISVNRMLNEWLWHNAMYGLGIATGSTRMVDVYLNAANPKWGWFF